MHFWWLNKCLLSRISSWNTLYYDTSGRLVFSFVFWKKLTTPKKHFKINWPLVVICGFANFKLFGAQYVFHTFILCVNSFHFGSIHVILYQIHVVIHWIDSLRVDSFWAFLRKLLKKEYLRAILNSNVLFCWSLRVS